MSIYIPRTKKKIIIYNVHRIRHYYWDGHDFQHHAENAGNVEMEAHLILHSDVMESGNNWEQIRKGLPVNLNDLDEMDFADPVTATKIVVSKNGES